MKTTQEIAQVILNKRNSMNPLIQQGQMVNELGSDGLQEALRRRWLIPETDSGFLQVNNQLAVVDDIRANAEICESCGCKECECKQRQQESAKPSAHHQLVMEHAHVKPSTVQGVLQEAAPVQELLSPGTGRDGSAPMAPAAPVAPVRPVTPAAPTAGRAESPEIGDSVLVTQEGKTYTGVVGGMKDGRYTVSFGAEKPGKDMEYGPEQIRLVKKAHA